MDFFNSLYRDKAYSIIGEFTLGVRDSIKIESSNTMLAI
jgi:hypothetical protein